MEGDAGGRGATRPGGPPEPGALEAEVRRLREREARYLRLLEEAQRHAERSRAFMLALGALSTSDTLFRQGLDAALAEILARSRRELGVARAGVWLFSDDQASIECVCVDEDAGQQSAPPERVSAASAPAYFAALAAARVIAASDAQHDPRTRELAPSYLVPRTITSLLDAPVRTFGEAAGVVCHEQVGAPRTFTEEERSFAAAIGDLVALALTTAEREKAEGIAATSAARFRHLVESLPATVYSYHPDAPVLDYLSPQIESLTGHGPSHWLMGGDIQRWFEAVHPEDRTRVVARFDHATRTQDDGEITYRVRHCTDGWRWVRDAHRIMRNADGQALGLQGVLLDITEAVSARRELDEHRRQVQELIARADQLAVVLDREGRIGYVNDATCRLLGRTWAQLKGQDWFSLVVSPEQREQIRGSFLRDVRQGTIAPWTENEMAAPDGSKRLLHWNTVVQRDGDGRVIGTASLGSDLTDRLASEARRRENEKFESLGRLAAGVAHDFNNLLTAMVGATDMLASKDGQADESLAVIREAARHASVLTNSLLGFARLRALPMQLVEIDPVLDRARATLQALLGRHTLLVTELNAPGQLVRVDPAGLEQVLLNLVVNARDAMPGGGRIHVGTEVVFVDAETGTRLGDLPAGTYVTLFVRDEGVGMDGAVVAHVFEPFFTTKEQGRGTGLGLAISYGVVRHAKGTIHVESREGAGSTFTVYLPKIDDQTAAEDGIVPAPAPPPPAGAESAIAPPSNIAQAGPILLVDDDPLVARVLAEGLRHQGFTVHTATSAAAALELAGAESSAISVLITDVRLGRVDGLTLARRFRETYPKSRVVLMSGDQVPEVDGLSATVLLKPISPLELGPRIRALLDGDGHGHQDGLGRDGAGGDAPARRSRGDD